MNEQLFWLWLAQRPRLGAKGLRELVERFGRPRALFEADAATLERAGLSPGLQHALLDKNLQPARAILQACERLDIAVLTPDAANYPAILWQTADAPAVLYCRGTLPARKPQPWVGLVGSREADAYGLALASRFGADIAASGGVVVTGMAKGIDAAAAHGALAQGRPVVGVLGCGVDLIYPRENAALFQSVIENGCLLSEYPPGTAPNARHFPARNRIISALSDGIVVIRATEESGALITARWAREQGRDVFSVPGLAGDPLSRGCNRLLRDGAIVAESGLDVMQAYVYRYPGAVRLHNTQCKMQKEGAGVCRSEHRYATEQTPPPESERKNQTDEKAAAARGTRPRPENLSPEQAAIVAALQGGPMQLDALIDKTGLPAAKVLPQLTVLQIRQILSQEPGKIYKLL